MTGRLEAIGVVAIVAVSVVVRVYPAWNATFGGDHVDFLETDAWYHLRLVENQVRNWPLRLTLDPYAAPGGQYVPIAPLFDTITATVVRVLGGPDASTALAERVAALMPPVFGALTIVALWALARRAFDERAALIGAALLAVLPGHFLDRTMLGFYDHHALESCLAMTVLWTLAMALRAPELAKEGRRSSLVGVALALYLLTWSSGAFLLGVLGVWLVVLIPLARPLDLSESARVTGIAALVALVIVLVFQDSCMYRYASQILGLTGLAAIAFGIRAAGATRRDNGRSSAVIFGKKGTLTLAAGVAIVVALVLVVVWWLAPGVLTQVLADVGRLAPDPKRMAVLEARPLFLYSGNWQWKQPWDFFHIGFFVGLIGLIAFTWRVWRGRRPIDAAIWIFTATMFAATIGQNRFGYYLVPACALLGGWLATELVEWTSKPRAADADNAQRSNVRLQRELATAIVAVALITPNISPAIIATRSGTEPEYWHQTVTWLRDHTPPPFAVSANRGEDFYFARYDRALFPDYSVMNWWDHGYWITQVAHRVPVANPTQERAPVAARFYASTDEANAVKLLRTERSRYVLADFELPFRFTQEGAIMGRFQSVVDWAGGEHARYYDVFYKREGNAWTPVWVFHPAYYRSMAYRLVVLGGAQAVPAGATSVISIVDRTDDTGMKFQEVLNETTYDTYEEAEEAARGAPPTGRAVIAGLDPWRAAFPVERLLTLHEVYAARTSGQKPTESPWVRVFELR